MNKVNFYIVSARNVFTERLEKLVDKLNAQNYVKLLEFVHDEKLRELYEKSVGFIYPSLSEGFGLPGLEAMQAGTIVLASDIPVFREIYGNHVIYFNPIDQRSIESAMRKALTITKLEGERIIRTNKEFVRRYSWEKMAKETLDVYETALL